MKLEDWQQRVCDEQAELNKKLVKLIEFTSTEAYRNLPMADKQLLEMQQDAMAKYNLALSDRIARFGVRQYMSDYPKEVTTELLALLDRIEVEDNHELASQRFDIMEKYGFKVVFAENLGNQSKLN